MARGEATLDRLFLDDVLIEVFLRVGRTGGNAIFRCMEVSKQWKRVAQSAILELTWTAGTNPLEAALQTARFENLTSLTMDRCRAVSRSWPPVFEALGQNCPHLTSLHMWQVNPLLDSPDIGSLLANCQELTAVRLNGSLANGTTFPTTMGGVSSLHHLHVDFTSRNNGRIAPPGWQLVPSLDCLSGLTTLSLQNVPLLVHLPPLNPLTNLRHLSLASCRDLEDIPPLGSLSLLETLELHTCCRLRLLPRLDHLPRLHTLLINACTDLQSMAGVECLTQLRVLDIGFCEGDNVILPGLTALQNLEKLGFEVYSGRNDWVPDWISQLTKLQLLALPSYANFYGAPAALQASSLLRLEIHSRGACFTDTPSLDALTNLRELIFDSRLVNPRNCYPFEVDMVDTCPSLAALMQLERLLLKMPHLQHWRDERPFASLGCLVHLCLNQCIYLEQIPVLTGLGALQSLTIRSCRALRVMPSLDGSPHLREVWLHSLDSLQELPALGALTQLGKLVVLQCPSITEIPPLEGLTALEDLCLVQCGRLAKLPMLSGLAKLRALILMGCSNLRALPALDGLPCLRWLDLQGCSGLRPTSRGSLQLWWEGRESLQVIWPDEHSRATRQFFEFQELHQEAQSGWRSWNVDYQPLD